MNKKIGVVVRWLFLVPAVLLVYALTPIISYYIMRWFDIQTFEKTNIHNLFYQCFLGVLLVLFFIMTGVSIAPSNKNKVRKVLAILMSVFLCIELYLYIPVIKESLPNIKIMSFYKNVGLTLIIRHIISLCYAIYFFFYDLE